MGRPFGVIRLKPINGKPITQNSERAVYSLRRQENVIQLLYRVNRPSAQFNYTINGLLLFLGQVFELEKLRLGKKSRQGIVEHVAYFRQLRTVG